MSSFRDILRELNVRLDLPQPAKSRILLEIAADLQDLAQYYREQGMDEGSAHARAIEMCDLSDDAVAELVSVHRPALKRFMDGLSMRAQQRWERTALLLTLLCVVLIAGRQVALTDLTALASGFKWPVLGSTALIAFLGLHKAFELYVKRRHDPRLVRRRLDLILILTGVTLLFGIGGGAFELYQMCAAASADMDHAGYHVMLGLLESASLMVICLSSAMLSALMWFALASKVAAIERAELAYLLAE